ncbi:MAG: hypothetical protein AMQ22_00218 [Candidatus Methanofastidiosum methylothiophilum]|uniref:Uncharacterized protein n=1 Tax=Candidatus Methanofastidiosum methylothiophilum TaxID=1705564 RepID=A0A150J8J0_9EURY|nr:MAG: hypothetical protein AMQ22_00218 [Candidatus Methanofastidiosum methylthiophilus]
MVKEDDLKITALEIADKAFPAANKVDLLVEMVDKIDAEIDEIKEKILELQDRKKALENLKGMTDAIIKKGIMKDFNGFQSKITIVPSTPRVDIIDEKLVPAKYKRIKIIVEIDKKAILKDYRDTGELPPGVDLEKTSWVKYYKSKANGERG